jgi:DNA repair photolyase
MKSIRKRFNQKTKELYLDGKELKTNLGSGNIIFVGSSNDIFAVDNGLEIMIMVLEHCQKYPGNKYLFQTKDPASFVPLLDFLPPKSDLGTTIETNKKYPCMGNTPSPDFRSYSMQNLGYAKKTDRFKTFVTIEPILEFDLDRFTGLLKDCNADYINIGADSGNNHLPEPEPEKIRELIKELEKFTKVHLKKNLKRLLPEI